jgi:hypothetical protein
MHMLSELCLKLFKKIKVREFVKHEIIAHIYSSGDQVKQNCLYLLIS